MASINDQFEQGRIPIKVLSYKDAIKKLAQCDELIIDYLPSDDGITDPSYHIYIADHNDPENLIDITNLIIKEILPNAKINANEFQILIEGVRDPTSLKNIINFIYKRFTYPENIEGFDYARDSSKLFGPTTVSVLLKNTDNTILLPVTTIDNVYDNSGNTIEDRLNNITRVGFGVTYVRATEDYQTEFIFDYPFENYSDFIEVRVGGTYISKDRYSVTNVTVNDVVKGKITFLDINGNYPIEVGRRIDILFIYNTKAISGANEYIYGHNIADGSIPSSKLEKLSDSYTLNDSTSVASSSALYKLFYAVLYELHSNNKALLWGIDNNDTNYMNFSTQETISNGAIITLTLLKDKTSFSNIRINDTNYSLKNIDGSNFRPTKIKAGTTIRILLDTSSMLAYVLSDNIFKNKKVQSVFTCTSDNEGITTIPYDFNSNNDPSSDIIVYRNGVRLFEYIDYTLNSDNTITLEVRVNGPSASNPLSEGERIVFETNRI